MKIEIPQSIPAAIRAAALRYATELEADGLDAALFNAFDVRTIGDPQHRAAAWLCQCAVRKVIYGWQALECDGNGPEISLNRIRDWILSNTLPNLSNHFDPFDAKRNGKKIVDCDACRAEPIASAVAHTARYCQNANVDDATEAIHSVWNAIDEGIHWPDSMPFESWLVTIALPVAFDRRELTERELKI